MEVTKMSEQNSVKLLKAFKQNYNFTSHELAHELGVSDAMISNWFNDKAKPQTRSIQAIDTFLLKNCIPGVIKLPPLPNYWTDYYFLSVADIKNPYAKYDDNLCSGQMPDVFNQWVEEWGKICPNPQIYRSYEPGPRGRAAAYLDSCNIMTAVEFRKWITQCSTVDEVFRTYPHWHRASFDKQAVAEIICGDL